MDLQSWCNEGIYILEKKILHGLVKFASKRVNPEKVFWRWKRTIYYINHYYFYQVFYIANKYHSGIPLSSEPQVKLIKIHFTLTASFLTCHIQCKGLFLTQQVSWYPRTCFTMTHTQSTALKLKLFLATALTVILEVFWHSCLCSLTSVY